jgi:hypothetical protein
MHIEKIERIQGRANKHAPGRAALDYNLIAIGTGGQCISNLHTVSVGSSPVYGFASNWNHNESVKEVSNNSIRSNFFNNRIARVWNSIHVEVINANSVNSFKSNLDKWYKSNNNSWYKGRDGDIKGSIA